MDDSAAGHGVKLICQQSLTQGEGHVDAKHVSMQRFYRVTNVCRVDNLLALLRVGPRGARYRTAQEAPAAVKHDRAGVGPFEVAASDFLIGRSEHTGSWMNMATAP